MNPRDPRIRRAAVRSADQLDGVARLELATEDWRHRIRSEVEHAANELEGVLGLGPGYPEDFLSEPPAGAPLETTEAANLPASSDEVTILTPELAAAVQEVTQAQAHAAGHPTPVDDCPSCDPDRPRPELAGFRVPVPAPPCTCHPEANRWECLASCLACMALPEDQECPAQLLWQAQRAAGDGGLAPEPGPAPAAQLTGHRPLDNPGPDDEPWHCQECGGPCQEAAGEVSLVSSAVPVHGGRALAWASNHDPRSLEFLVRARLAGRVPVQDIAREHGPILDQGTVPPLSLHDGSSCTGNMAVNLRNMLELATVPPYTRDQDVPMLTEADALRLYEAAQQLDEWPGDDYPGTSVLAAMKAGQAAGWWTGYLWATSVGAVAQALLQVGPVGIGVPFLEGMADPGPDGIVHATGKELGGHALCLYALRRTVAGQPGPWFGALQSYGPGVGDGGTIWIHATDLARLLAHTGEAAVPYLPGMLP